MAKAACFLLQFRSAVSPDRLHEIRRHSHQQTHFPLKFPTVKTLSPVRVTFCGIRINPNIAEQARFVRIVGHFQPVLSVFTPFFALMTYLHVCFRLLHFVATRIALK
jgi:hypothetical protein